MERHYSLMKDPHDFYLKVQLVGEGTFGHVFKGEMRNRKTSKIRTVAMKKIKLGKEKMEGFPITALREISLHLSDIITSRPNDERGGKTEVYLIFEYMEFDLAWYVSKIKKNEIKVEPKHIKCLMKQFFEGIHGLHSQKILHRDIKSSNLLLNRHGQLKITDFGLAKFLQNMEHLTPKVVTLWWRAPEILLGQEDYGWKSDVWSAGIVFLEMLTGKILFYGCENELDMITRLYEKFGLPTEESWPGVGDLKNFRRQRPTGSFPEPRSIRMILEGFQNPNLDEEAMDLIEHILVPDPTKRYDTKQILSHPYFASDKDIARQDEIPMPVEGHEINSKEEKLKADSNGKRTLEMMAEHSTTDKPKFPHLPNNYFHDDYNPLSYQEHQDKFLSKHDLSNGSSRSRSSRYDNGRDNHQSSGVRKRGEDRDYRGSYGSRHESKRPRYGD
eukprot:CAMPEP_0115032222 /NCGR_PEP_ID=MMETSP0216-20121206/39026_1 /TAXON_ID=223996 /ORGANISM="Protocruzia adherens, Strain Boccale" /LENGTH=442 /DNA_ID=CAMNT_0002410073 /DNA_START=27 /DNA_END=1355 /DNA_ORIENTATION=-